MTRQRGATFHRATGAIAMRHVIRVITLILFAAVIAGCQKTQVKPDYERYTELVRQQEQERQARIAAIANTSDCNGDATCIVAAKALAAMSEASGPKQTIAPPAPKRTFGDRVESVAKTFVGQLPALGGLYVSDRSSERQAQTQQRQYEFLENVTVTGLNAAAEIAQSGPSITVGGNYGNTDNSTHGPIGSYNQDNDQDNDVAQSGDGSAFGDGNEVINGNGNGNGNNVGNDNRQGSDGPIDNSDPGDDCSGESCNPVEEPNEPAQLTAPKSTDPVGDAIHDLRMDLIDVKHQLHINKLTSDHVDWMGDAIRRSNQTAEESP